MYNRGSSRGAVLSSISVLCCFLIGQHAIDAKETTSDIKAAESWTKLVNESSENGPTTLDYSTTTENTVLSGARSAQDIIRNIRKLSNNEKSSVKNTVEAVANRTTVDVNDCLGLGLSIAMQLEWLLKKNANGTKAQNARFYMSSRKKPRKVEVMIGKQFGLEWTDFDIKRNTAVIIHGFLSNGNETWIEDMTNAYLTLEDVNVIDVDWSDGGDTYNYYKAVVNTQTTGNQLATLFGQITNYTLEKNESSEEQWGTIHCIGHSLGAHICGYAANEIKRRRARWTIRRITGLDPAQPCFKTADLALKLDKNDAPFVDIIHTNGRFLKDLGLGLPQPIGHIDFFPNGGKQQPGCEITKYTIPILSVPKEAINKAICNHGRSYLYFTESIINSVGINCTFWAHPWDGTYRNIEQIVTTNCTDQICSEMGINSDKYQFKGSFFALTSASSPYCHSEYWDKQEVKNILKEDYKETLED